MVAGTPVSRWPGPGAPLVAEFCIAEFAAALGRSTDSGRMLIADALELKYRLPRLQARVESGSCRCGGPAGSPKPPSGSPMEAAGFVDAQVAGFAHKIGLAALDRLVAEAIARYMPDLAVRTPNRRPRGGTSPSTTTRSPSRAPAGSRASSTSLMPWTSTPP